jgi:hypothetical protein
MMEHPNYDVTEVAEVRAAGEVNELLCLGWRLLAVEATGPRYVLGRPQRIRPVPRPDWLDTPLEERMRQSNSERFEAELDGL